MIEKDCNKPAKTPDSLTAATCSVVCHEPHHIGLTDKSTIAWSDCQKYPACMQAQEEYALHDHI